MASLPLSAPLRAASAAVRAVAIRAPGTKWPRACARASSTNSSTSHSPSPPLRTTVDEAELRKFAAESARWWEDDDSQSPGRAPFAGLHRMNSVRVPFIRNALTRGNSLSSGSVTESSPLRPLEGLRVLDAGCGGGILAEPLARLGARVTGIDAEIKNVAAAEAHAKLDPSLEGRLDYRCTTLEEEVGGGGGGGRGRGIYDAVVCSEVLEHVAHLPSFIEAVGHALKPDGVFVATTINRTVGSFAAAVLGAEYVLRLVPAGTHEWAKFVTPKELEDTLAERAGMEVTRTVGLAYNPLSKRWSFSPDVRVNYGVVARKVGGSGRKGGGGGEGDGGSR